MFSGIIISGDFSTPGSPLLAGPTEDALRPTKSCVADGTLPKITALRELADGFVEAVVIDNSFNVQQGWVASKTTFRKVSKRGDSLDRPPQMFDPDGE